MAKDKDFIRAMFENERTDVPLDQIVQLHASVGFAPLSPPPAELHRVAKQLDGKTMTIGAALDEIRDAIKGYGETMRADAHEGYISARWLHNSGVSSVNVVRCEPPPNKQHSTP